MARRTRQEREEIARTRLLRVLKNHGVATARTLEQKISDAGPNPLRVDPHILTDVRNSLTDEGLITRLEEGGTTWYSRADVDPKLLKSRLAQQLPVFKAITAISSRTGQALEIATYRSLSETTPVFFGDFPDLAEHADDKLYRKIEPPQHIGRRRLEGKQSLDFIVHDQVAGYLGLECKNVREWLYPARSEIRETAVKCIALECVPVLIARRIPYVTFRLLNACGFIIHQTYNQLIPATTPDEALKAKLKDNLGYHDLRTGNNPDARLLKFIGQDMVKAAPDARKRFEEYKDILAGFAEGDFDYNEFAARVRRREKGQNEDHDWEGEPDPADWG